MGLDYRNATGAGVIVLLSPGRIGYVLSLSVLTFVAPR